MKKVLLIMLLLGGTVATTYAQRGWDRGRGHGHGHGHGYGHNKHYDKWEKRYWRDRDCRDDYYRPRRRVVYAEPAYYPVPVPVPPPPRPYYAPRPRAVFHAGVTIVN